MVLKINDPEKDPEGDWFSVDMVCNRLTLLADFKEQVAARIGLETNCFVLVEERSGKQMKEIGKTLSALGLSEGNKIKVKIGSPEEEGVYDINIVAVQIADVKGNDH